MCPVLATVPVCSTILVQHSFVTLNHLLAYRIILTIMYVHFFCHYQAYGFLCFSIHISLWFWRSGTITVVLFITVVFQLLTRNSPLCFLAFYTTFRGYYIYWLLHIHHQLLYSRFRGVLIFTFFAR